MALGSALMVCLTFNTNKLHSPYMHGKAHADCSSPHEVSLPTVSVGSQKSFEIIYSRAWNAVSVDDLFECEV